MLKPLEVLRLYPAHDGSLSGVFQSRLGQRADQPFATAATETITWAEADLRQRRLTSRFKAAGIGPGDRVAIMSRNSLAHVLALLALSRLGAILVPVNPDFRAEEAAYVLGHADVSGLIISDEVRDVAREAIATASISPWLMSIGEATQPPEAVDLAPVPDAAQKTCIIIYTSGTTGRPKGVMHSQRNFVLAGEAFVQRVSLQPQDRAMIVLPMFHMNALFYSVAGALVAGASLVIVEKFSASSFWKTAADSGATVVNIIEAMGSILKMRARAEFVPHAVRAAYGVRSSSAKVFREEFGIKDLFSGFGMTEIPGVTCNTAEGPNKDGSMGILGIHPDPDMPWAECRVVDDEYRDVAPDTVGELLVRTPIVMQGYYRDEEQTRQAFRDGWFSTGDLVRRDVDGFYFFVSRKKDIIRRRGENIAGAELDRVIGEHPGVQEVAAIAVPSDLGEDDILVAIVRKPGQDVEAPDIESWCRERLAPQKVPRYVAFRETLPHTPTHKVAKEMLRRDEALRATAIDLQR